MPKSFFEKMHCIQQERNSLLCIGINPEDEKIKKARSVIRRNSTPIEVLLDDIPRETRSSVVAFKINPAFFLPTSEQECLKRSIRVIQRAFETPVILDARYSHTGISAKKCAQVAFDAYAANAVTVNPYLGMDTIEPYLKHGKNGEGVIAIVRTFNSNGENYQKTLTESGLMLYERVILDLMKLNAKYGGNRIGLFIGSTDPEEIGNIRERIGKMPILIPKLTEKESDYGKILKAGMTPDGFGVLSCISDEIIYHDNPLTAAELARDQINLYRPNMNEGKGVCNNKCRPSGRHFKKASSGGFL